MNTYLSEIEEKSKKDKITQKSKRKIRPIKNKIGSNSYCPRRGHSSLQFSYPVHIIMEDDEEHRGSDFLIPTSNNDETPEKKPMYSTDCGDESLHLSNCLENVGKEICNSSLKNHDSEAIKVDNRYIPMSDLLTLQSSPEMEEIIQPIPTYIPPLLLKSSIDSSDSPIKSEKRLRDLDLLVQAQQKRKNAQNISSLDIKNRLIAPKRDHFTPRYIFFTDF